MAAYINHYTEAEIKLFKYFDLDENYLNFVNPPEAFRYAAEIAFMRADNSIYTDILRKCLAAINNCSPYRNTPEYFCRETFFKDLPK